MRVIIDENNVDLGAQENPTFGALLEEAEKFASGEGKIITQITYNGELVTPEDEVTRQMCACNSTDCIRMSMATPEAVIIKALKEADQDIPGIVENLRQVATHLQTGARQAAYTLLSECIEQWKQVINLFRIVESVLDLDSREVIIDGRTLDQTQGELLSLLVETRKSMQDDDSITLSDLIEYELAPMVEGQRVIIQHLVGIAVDRETE